MQSQPPASTSAILTGAEVCERLRISRMTLSVWCRRGVFPNAFQIGSGERGRWRIPVADVEAYEESRRQSAATHSAALNPTSAATAA